LTPIISEQHREERKLIILNAAKEVFISKGFNGATIQDIINHSGVSRGGVYTYFANTEEIFIELLKSRDSEDILDIDLLYQKAETSWEVLILVLDQIETTIENQSDLLVPAIYEYYFTIGWQTKNHLPLLEKRIEQAKDSFAAILNKGKAAGEFSPLLPVEDIARTIITFCDGIYLSSFHLGPGKAALKNQFKVFRTYLASILKKGGH
jgi:AcrR family transcriptional regulator